MVKLLVFAILLASSPATGLVEKLFNAETTCYSGCSTNYAATTDHLEACRKGCNFKLHYDLDKDAASQCQSAYKDAKLRAACQVGCTLSPTVNKVIEKPAVAVDPVPEIKLPGFISGLPGFPGSGSERPRSIILIRLRQRPSVDMPSVQQMFGSDPIQMFNDMIKRFQEKAGDFDQAIRKSFEENSKDLPKPGEFGTISELVKNIPIIRLPINVRADSSSESSEENSDKRPLIDEFRHIIQHPRENQQYIRERMQPVNNRIRQFFTDIRAKWNDLVRREPKIPVWIFLGILISSSLILWYMVMSLCRHAPNRNLSVRAQELVFHPYDYEGYEKEKIQPDDQPYEVTESYPIKVKLSNI